MGHMTIGKLGWIKLAGVQFLLLKCRLCFRMITLLAVERNRRVVWKQHIARATVVSRGPSWTAMTAPPVPMFNLDVVRPSTGDQSALIAPRHGSTMTNRLGRDNGRCALKPVQSMHNNCYNIVVDMIIISNFNKESRSRQLNANHPRHP